MQLVAQYPSGSASITCQDFKLGMMELKNQLLSRNVHKINSGYVIITNLADVKMSFQRKVVSQINAELSSRRLEKRKIV